MIKKIFLCVLCSFAFIACGNEDEIITLDELTKLEIEGDIEKTVQRIKYAGKKGNYEYVDILLDQCQNSVVEIKEASGLALEKIVGVEFGFSSSNERTKNQAIKKAQDWWNNNREDLIRGYIFKKFKPYLELEFNGEARAKMVGEFPIIIRDFLLRDIVSYEIKKIKKVTDVFYSMQIMSDLGDSVWSQFDEILKQKNESQLLKEKIAFILSKQKPSLLKKYMPEIMLNCSQIDKRCGLYRVWSKADLPMAKKHLWEDYNKAKNIDKTKYLKTLVGFDADKVSEYLLGMLKSSNPAIALDAIRFIGEFGFSEHIESLVDALPNNDTNAFRESFATACFQLGMKRAIVKLREKATDNTVIESDRMICFNTMVQFSEYMNEYEDKIVLVQSKDEKSVLAGAILLQDGKASKTAAYNLIEALKQGLTKSTEKEVLKALVHVTGHDFEFDEKAYSVYSQRERGLEEEKRKTFRYLKAKEWWIYNRNISRKHWIYNALMKAGFASIAQDKHILSDKEEKLLSIFVELDEKNGLEYLKVAYETGNAKNKDSVLKILREKNIAGRVEFLLSKMRDRRNKVDPIIAQVFCRVADESYHKELRQLVDEKNLVIAKDASDAIIKISGFREIESLIYIVENADEERAVIANKLLQKISENDYGRLVSITKPERKKIVDAWKNWWRVVYDDSYVGAWQKKEIDRLVAEINIGKLVPEYKRRIESLTHYQPDFNDADSLKKFWQKHGSHWSLNSRYVIDLTSDNWWRVEKAQVILMANATLNDVTHMIYLLDPATPRRNDRILSVLRVLTQIDMEYCSTLTSTERKNKIGKWKFGWLNHHLSELNHVTKNY